jgi:hypothetical protein
VVDIGHTAKDLTVLLLFILKTLVNIGLNSFLISGTQFVKYLIKIK